MPSAAEVAANRRQTTAFIGFDPREIRLQYADLVATPAGGTLRQPLTSRLPQTGRLLPVGAGMATPVRRMVDGEEVTASYVLVLAHDALVARGDWFYVNGIKYEVVWVPESVDRTYQTKCEVTLRG